MRHLYRAMIAGLFGLVMLGVHASPIGHTLEREYGLPLLYALRGPVPAPPEAVVIGLDNASVRWLVGDAHGLRQKAPNLANCLPERAHEDLRGAVNINHIPRSVHACLLDVLTPRKPRVILFDINFSRQRHDDEHLAGAIRRSGNVLLFVRVSSSDETHRVTLRPRPLFEESALGTMGFHADSARGEMVTGYITGFPDEPALRTMPEAAWAVWTGRSPRPRPISVQPLWLYGPPQTVRTVALEDVFDPSTPDPLPLDMRDMAVFIGASDLQDASIDDHFPIPTAARGRSLMGGVELAATGFLNLLHGQNLKQPEPFHQLTVVFLTAFLGALAVTMLTRWMLSAVLIALPIGYLAAASVAFSEFLIWLPVAVPVFLTTLCLALGAISVRYFFVRSLVGRLVPRQVAASLMDSTVAQRRSARLENATIMFTDLVGSTALAEGMSEVDYTRAANLYYDTATEIVEGHRGMVVEFLGDGILAMFSESVSGRDHAHLACKAALDLSRRMDVRNAETDLPDLRLRIGINSGLTAIGDIGARTRFNYKALGDVVNVAARLEQHGKTLESGAGHIILISQRTYDAAGASVAVDPVGTIELRGRAQPVGVFRLQD